MNDFILYLLIFIILICHRAIFIKLLYPLINSPYFHDAAYHLKRIKMCKNKLGNRKLDDYIIGTEESYYPILFHQLCSFMPINLIVKFTWLPNLLVFLFGSLMFFFISLNTNTIVLSYKLIIYLLFFYLISMSNMLFYGNGYHYLGLSERLLAKTISGFYVFSLYLFLQTENNLFLIIAILSGVMTFYLSQFGRQSIILFSAILSCLLLNITPILICLIILILSFIISPTIFKNSIKNWLFHLKSYFYFMQKSIFWQNSLSGFTKPKILWDKRKNIKKLFFYILNSEPNKSLFLIFSELLFIGYLLATKKWTFEDHNLFFCFIISAFIVSMLTSFKKLNFIGESYRYIEYSLFFLFPYYLGIYSSSDNLALEIFVIYAVYTIVVSQTLNLIIKKKTPLPKYKKVLSLLKNYTISKTDVVASMEPSLIRLINIFSNCSIFTFSSYYEMNMVEKLYGYQFPYLKKEAFDYFKKYNVNKFVLEKELIKITGIHYNFSAYTKDYEDDHFIVYKVN
ncbi:hypothetical protein DID74_00260 [Candidatus Marinamargulisbacteria bacterium SCGC AG-333-B06]|nr:hypothetical protein DID74_00260 [Candidatus Marinamargulisbacteria bacterium SCGC AG-333-B06]